MKTIQLDQEFLDKIVLDELKDYREVMVKNLQEDFASEKYTELEAFRQEDFNRHVSVIAALDIIIDEYTVP